MTSRNGIIRDAWSVVKMLNFTSSNGFEESWKKQNALRNKFNQDFYQIF